MRVYISGAISGTDDYIHRFLVAQKKLEKEGHTVINPVLIKTVLPNDFDYEEIMKVDLFLLEMCEAIYMMNNWENSSGANREIQLAIKKEKIVMYEK